jgi:hypothetical protein
MISAANASLHTEAPYPGKGPTQRNGADSSQRYCKLSFPFLLCFMYSLREKRRQERAGRGRSPSALQDLFSEYVDELQEYLACQPAVAHSIFSAKNWLLYPYCCTAGHS